MNTRDIIQSTLDYIDNNVKAEFTVNDLCNIAGYSYVHYCRLFQHLVGLTPAEYITHRKLLYAVYDMLNGVTNIDVALSYGFETYAGFYKAFKREFNCSPSEFIKDYKGTKPYKINILQEEHIMISKTKIQKVLKYWNLQNESITNIYNENTGKQNDNAFYVGDDYVIKFTANLGNIKNNINITKSLSNVELPVATVIKTTNGAEYLQDGELYFIVTKRMKGQQLKCEDIFNNIDIAYQIGESISKLHQALITFDSGNYTEVNIYNDVVNSALSKVKDIINLSDSFINDYTNNFGAINEKLSKQIIHRDINPSNMIFDDGKFNGFIDFDLTEINVRIFDICYCATSILSECFADSDINKDKWIDILNNLVLGYESISPLSDDEKQALPYVIYSIQIICIAYFSQFDKYKELTKINIDMLKWIIERLK